MLTGMASCGKLLLSPVFSVLQGPIVHISCVLRSERFLLCFVHRFTFSIHQCAPVELFVTASSSFSISVASKMAAAG